MLLYRNLCGPNYSQTVDHKSRGESPSEAAGSGFRVCKMPGMYGSCQNIVYRLGVHGSTTLLRRTLIPDMVMVKAQSN